MSPAGVFGLFAAVTHSSKEAPSLAPVSPGDKVQTPHSCCLFLSANSSIIQQQYRALRRCAAIRQRPDLFWGAAVGGEGPAVEWHYGDQLMHVKHCIHFFFSLFLLEQVVKKKRLQHNTLNHHTWSSQRGREWLPHPSSQARQHLSIQAVRSLVGPQEEGASCIHSLTMIKTHSEEPFKSPVPIMESLIGAYSAGKVFSEGAKKKFQGSNNHFVCCLVYVKCMQRSTPPPFSNSFCCLFFPFSFKKHHQ